MGPWLDRLGGYCPAERRSWVCGVPGLAGLKGPGLQSEYCAGLCRSWVHGPAEIMQGCAGLGGGAWPGGDRKCLWIPGLKGSSHGDPVGLRGGSLR
jgi:hypothetical protein